MNKATLEAAAEKLTAVLSVKGGRLPVMLTGAGVSTASGIPDYRGVNGLYSKGHKPMTLQQFMNPVGQRRYFARSVLGFSAILHATPNPAHVAMAQMVKRGLCSHIVTQNVDGLHVVAAGAFPVDGHPTVTELHGSLHRVRCLSCGRISRREDLQHRLEEHNAEAIRSWKLLDAQSQGSGLRPDGDQQVDDDFIAKVNLVGCDQCGGALMPHLVFFGDNVDRTIVETTFRRVEEASALICVGTSLQVFSGYRFAKAAAEKKIPVIVVNQGPTRADEIADTLIDAPAHELLPLVTSLLAPPNS
jgi:NAD-dependent SIR2 family protein deacetylase